MARPVSNEANHLERLEEQQAVEFKNAAVKRAARPRIQTRTQ